MKINLKNKIMLAVLAGGMLYMCSMCAEAANFTYKVDDGPLQIWDIFNNLEGSGTKLEVWGEGVIADGRSISGNSTGQPGDGKTVIFNGGQVDTINGGSYGNVTNNTVIVNGGMVTKQLCGGLGFLMGNASENTVTINGGTFVSSLKLWGGQVMMGTSSNNTLNLKTKMNGKIAEVNYFQAMNFTLPTGIGKNSVMLSTASVVYDNTTITVDADPTTVGLHAGDVITLIQADSSTGTLATVNETLVLDDAAKISIDGNNIKLVFLTDYGSYFPQPLIPARNYDKEKAPVEGIAAGVAMVNQSADLASGEGMTSLQKETADGFANTFGAITATRSKYKTGSHVDMDGWGVLIGAGNTKNWNNGQKTTYGLFFEYGKGDFDTYNNDIHGEGDSKNEGVGIMARHTLKNNTYIDGVVRYGKQETEWSESEIGGYDTDSRYYGAAVGLGHIYPLGKNEIDIYGRYSFGHTGACDAKVKDSDYHFDSVKSHRIRLGAKYNFVQEKSNAKPYVGLAWEHEFNGESKATITGVGEAPAPSLKGNTGIMEFGIDWETGDWLLGLGGEAYVGKRKGWSGMARAFYNF